MPDTFYETFKPVVGLLGNGGFYLPNCEVIYPKYGLVIKKFFRVILYLSTANYLIAAGGEISLLFTGQKTVGMTKYFVVITFSFFIPFYFTMVYAQIKSQDIVRIIDIWEKDMQNPPYIEDREMEIAAAKKYMTRVVKLQVYFLILPFTIWSCRPFVTAKPILPSDFAENANESPLFEIFAIFFIFFAYRFSSVWSAVQSLQLLFMKVILAELQHLRNAIDKIFILKMPRPEPPSYSDENESKSKERARALMEVRKNLKIWVLHHQSLIRFSNGYNEFIGPVILLQNTCFVLFAYTGFFIVLMGDLQFGNKASGFLFLPLYYYIMFRSSTLGEEIQTKSRYIFEAFHGKDWFLYPKDVLKNILIIQEVTLNRPIRLKATGSKDLSRKSFGEITKNGYELLTFMVQLFKRNKL